MSDMVKNTREIKIYKIKICYGILFPVVRNIKFKTDAEIDELKSWIEEMVNCNVMLCLTDMKGKVYCVTVSEIRSIIIKEYN